MKRLNIKLIGILFASVALFCGGMYGLHSIQKNRTAGSLKDGAAQAWEEAKKYKDSEDPKDDTLIEKLTRASDLHQLYAGYRGKDAGARATWGLIKADLAVADDGRNSRKHYSHARSLMEQALQLPKEDIDDADRERLDEARRWLVNVYMAGRAYPDALQHLEFLLTEHPDENELKRLQVDCHIGLQKFEVAAKALESLIEDDPTQVRVHVRLATLLRDHLDKPAEAETVIEAAVAANPDSFEVYLERAGYYRRGEKIDEAKEDILKALSFADGTNDIRVIITAAEIFMVAKDNDAAREQLMRGIQEYPENELMYQSLYLLAVSVNDRESAVEWLEKGMKQVRQSGFLRAFYADQMLQTGQLELARESIEKLREMPRIRRGNVPYLEGRLAMQERNWIKARGKLNEARRTVTQDMVRQIDMQLANCHVKLGQTGDALQVLDTLIVSSPKMTEARLLRARVLFSMKRWDDSYRDYLNVVDKIGLEQFVAKYNDWGRLLNLADKKKDERLKERISQLVQSGEAGGVSALLAIVQNLLNENRDAEARRLLEESLAANDQEDRIWILLANLARRSGTTEDGLAVLDRADKALGEKLSIRLTRIGFLSLLPPEQAKPQLKAEGSEADRLDPAERESAYRALANALLRIGETAQAADYWKTLADMRPDDPNLLLTLLEVELARGNQEEAQDAINRIRSRLGAGSEYTYFAEAVRLISQIKTKPGKGETLSQKDRDRLDDASRFVRLAKKERPNWHDATRLEGGIAELRGETDKAVGRYLEAVNQGERSPRVLQRLVALLYSAGRADEIDEIMQILRDTPGSEKFIEGWESLISGGKNYSKIIASLQQQVNDNPRDVNKQFQLAQMLVLAEQFAEAEQVLRTVIDLNDGSADMAWTALVQILVNTQQTDEAKTVTAEAKTRLPPERAAKVLSRCYELLGDLEQAEKTFLAAVSADRSDLSALRSLATFYLRMAQQDRTNASDHIQKADPRMKELIAKGDLVAEEDREHVRWARRAMADRLAGSISLLVPSQRSYDGYKEAIVLLDANTLEGDEAAVTDRLMKAVVMSKRPEKALRREAITEFEAIKQDQKLRPGELYSLANLYEKVGRWDDCRRTMTELLGRTREPRFLSQMIHMILRNDNPRDDGTASSYLVQLKEQDPDSHLTAIAEARYLIATNRRDEGIQRMQRLIPRPPDPNKPEEKLIVRDVAVYLEQMEQIEAAKGLWNEYVAAEPAAALGLASFLGRHGELDEAFDLCDEELARNSGIIGSVIQVGLNSIRAEKASQTPALEKKHFDRVDRWFQQGMQAYPKSVTLKLQRGELYDIHGRYDDAEQMYRDLVEDSETPPQFRAVARNNLAFMLALRYKNDASGQRSLRDALKMIGDAIAVRGLTSDLLDTRGMVHLARDNTEQAITDLKVSIDDNPSGSKFFHLALAYDKAEDQEQAIEAMRRAIEDYGLESGNVASLERDKFTTLLARLGMD